MKRESAEGPLRSTTLQREGNFAGMKTIPLHWYCHPEHAGVRSRGSRPQEGTQVQDGGDEEGIGKG